MKVGNGIFCGNVSLGHGIFEVALPATVVLERWSNIPADFAVLTVGRACFRGGMCNNFCTWGCDGCPVEVKVSEEGCMS